MANEDLVRWNMRINPENLRAVNTFRIACGYDNLAIENIVDSELYVTETGAFDAIPLRDCKMIDFEEFAILTNLQQYLYKRNDVILIESRKDRRSCIAVVDGTSLDALLTYITVDQSKLSTGVGFSPRDFKFRKATQEDLVTLLKLHDKCYDFDNHELKRLRLSRGGKYWLIYDSKIRTAADDHSPEDDYLFDCGNYFYSEGQAGQYLDKLREFTLNFHGDGKVKDN